MPRGHVLPDGHTVAELRGEAGLTQDELATRSGYGLRTIGKIESSHPTTSPTLAAVATVLGEELGRKVLMSDLLGPPGGSVRDMRPLTYPSIISDHVQWLDLAESPAQLTETIVLRDSAPGVRRRVESIDAVRAWERQNFRTGVTRPTDCLTLIVRFAAERCCRDLRGTRQRGAITQPIELLLGRLVYWRIASPVLGETYELYWS